MKILYFIILFYVVALTCGENCYEKLGVDKSASTKEIQKVFRRLAMKYHPDKIQGSEEEKQKAETKFKELARCYEILSNEEERKKYDMSGYNEKYEQSSHFENFNFNDIFNQFFGSKSNGQGNKFFRFSTSSGGPTGEGFGFGGFPGFNTFSNNPRPSQSHHQQQQRSSHGNFHNQFQQPQQKPTKHKEIVHIGLEEVMNDNIKHITTKDGKKMDLKIEKGVPNNHIIKKGNYEFEIKIDKNNLFIRGEKSHKNDLYYIHTLKLEDLLMMDDIPIEIQFENIDKEEISVTINDISQLNYNENGILEYKIKNKGLPYFKQDTRGHLYVQFHIMYPVLNEKQKKYF